MVRTLRDPSRLLLDDRVDGCPLVEHLPGGPPDASATDDQHRRRVGLPAVDGVQRVVAGSCSGSRRGEDRATVIGRSRRGRPRTCLAPTRRRRPTPKRSRSRGRRVSADEGREPRCRPRPHQVVDGADDVAVGVAEHPPGHGVAEHVAELEDPVGTGQGEHVDRRRGRRRRDDGHGRASNSRTVKAMFELVVSGRVEATSAACSTCAAWVGAAGRRARPPSPCSPGRAASGPAAGRGR